MTTEESGRRNSVDGTATRYDLDVPGFKFRKVQKTLYSPKTVQTGIGAHPDSYSTGIGFLPRGKEIEA
jgi:hypothetical protein